MCDVGQGLALVKVLADQGIGVLVGAPLPAAIRLREIYLQASPFLDHLEVVELAAIVEGYRATISFGQLLQRIDGGAVYLGRVASRQFADQHVSTLAFHLGQQIATAVLALHRVTFPVTIATTILDDLRSTSDRDTIANLQLVQLAAVLPSPLFTGPTQLFIPGAAARLVFPDPCINGLVRNPHCGLTSIIPSHSTGNLFGRPLLLQLRLDVTQPAMPRSQFARQVAAALLATQDALAMGPMTAVTDRSVIVVLLTVTTEFPTDRATMTTQMATDSGCRQTCKVHLGDDFPLAGGKMLVRHQGILVRKCFLSLANEKLTNEIADAYLLLHSTKNYSLRFTLEFTRFCGGLQKYNDA